MTIAYELIIEKSCLDYFTLRPGLGPISKFVSSIFCLSICYFSKLTFILYENEIQRELCNLTGEMKKKKIIVSVSTVGYSGTQQCG